MTLSITKLCHYAECYCAECRDLFVGMLHFIMLGECHYAEWRLAEYRYAECSGTLVNSSLEEFMRN